MLRRFGTSKKISVGTVDLPRAEKNMKIISSHSQSFLSEVFFKVLYDNKIDLCVMEKITILCTEKEIDLANISFKSPFLCRSFLCVHATDTDKFKFSPFTVVSQGGGTFTEE